MPGRSGSGVEWFSVNSLILESERKSMDEEKTVKI
jgi:hypothetical protein